MKSVEDAIASVLNQFSAENGSNTPDFILAQYMLACLAAFNAASMERERWYGTSLRIGSAPSAPAVAGTVEEGKAPQFAPNPSVAIPPAPAQEETPPIQPNQPKRSTR